MVMIDERQWTGGWALKIRPQLVGESPCEIFECLPAEWQRVSSGVDGWHGNDVVVVVSDQLEVI